MLSQLLSPSKLKTLTFKSISSRSSISSTLFTNQLSSSLSTLTLSYQLNTTQQQQQQQLKDHHHRWFSTSNRNSTFDDNICLVQVNNHSITSSPSPTTVDQIDKLSIRLYNRQHYLCLSLSNTRSFFTSQLVVFSETNQDDIIDWFINTYGMPKSSSPSKLVDTTLPLRGRDFVLEWVYDYIKAAYTADRDPRQPIIVIVGAPGMGKTRLMESIGDYISTRDNSTLPKHHLDLSISFGSRTPYCPSLDSDPSLSICSRILYRYFVEGSGVSFQSFVETIKSYIWSVQIKLDQTQNPYERSSNLEAIVKSISNNLLNRDQSSPIFCNVIMTGSISHGDLCMAVPATRSLYVTISSTLSQKEYMYIARKMIGRKKSNLPQVKRALRFMGGWPSALDIFFKSIPSDLDSVNTSQLLELCDGPLNKLYPNQMDQTMTDIITHSIAGIIHDGFEEHEIKSPPFFSLKHSYCFTFSCFESISVPLNFIRRHLNTFDGNQTRPAFMVPLGKVIKLLETEDMNDRSWQELNEHFLSSKLSALKEVELEYVTLKDIYGDAVYFYPEMKDMCYTTRDDVVYLGDSKLLKGKDPKFTTQDLKGVLENIQKAATKMGNSQYIVVIYTNGYITQRMLNYDFPNVLGDQRAIVICNRFIRPRRITEHTIDKIFDNRFDITLLPLQ
ncbi:hypothetical protein DFA_11058 [Cavenderia fasciculata]|uniref:Uncharacterized protein n=1 Tax=Cavenderia fasciculata TaxID=261658 RepID=F4QEN6_CACFS|nr:uncharacterized protein DFA_11058 [Cavenderia fasciculata]EGG13297.1 hypothetical protein DFA_11058 [Cavenderia fasciculata]|eukprot:XP_004349996.1 hypothetical protein DFA_11058 [Cavenderia fasciculata]